MYMHILGVVDLLSISIRSTCTWSLNPTFKPNPKMDPVVAAAPTAWVVLKGTQTDMQDNASENRFSMAKKEKKEMHRLQSARDLQVASP